MSYQKVSALLALSLISSPIVLPANTPSYNVVHKASASMGTYVGELQEKWQFPSDHVPIALTFDHLHFASWNVLDAKYIGWVTEKNSQGLSRSMIADEHIYIGDSKLTIRDKHVANLVIQMISHSTHPRSVLCLQECSKSFLEELHSRLPAHFEMISSHGEAILLDRHHFYLLEAQEVPGIFKDEPYRTLQEIKIRRLDNGQDLRLVNIHLPGDPTKPGRFEFAHYLANTLDPSLTTIAMGDMNFNELEMSDAMKQAFQNESPFSLHSPYCTNISPYVFHSKAIDHFLLYSPDSSPVTVNTPDQLLPGLDSIVSLLQ